MKITYIGHACLMIDTGDVKIVTDPWFAGPAYCGQWNIFPKPINVELLNSADVIAISHGHEDHMHEQSLQKLSKEKPIFFPRLGYGSATEFLGSMGFTKVIEANTYRKYKLSKETSITYITNELDSIIIIEKGGKNFINLNDALHADPEHSIAAFTDILRKRYANIDVVFCGFGGASYYPNTFSVPGKSDLEIGQLREQVYVHNFCKIIHRLRPRIAVPFAADFVLLSPDQRWVNSIRFTRSKIKEYYEKYFQIDEKYSVAIYDMYSGDVLSDGKIFQYSPYRERMKDGGLNHLIDEQYTEEISSLKIEKCLDKQDEEMLGDSITNQLNHRSTVIKHAKLNKIKFCINVLNRATRH